MKRLTRKENVDYTTNATIHTVGFVVIGDRNKYYNNALKKLYELENLEEQLGCPLDVFVNINLGKIKFIYDKNGNRFYINDVGQYYRGFHAYRQSGPVQNLEYEDLIGKWDDYKKTWWLKEDKSE